MIAFAFPEWRCKGCRQYVEWADAVAITDEAGRCIGFRHVDCEAPE